MIHITLDPSFPRQVSSTKTLGRTFDYIMSLHFTGSKVVLFIEADVRLKIIQTDGTTGYVYCEGQTVPISNILAIRFLYDQTTLTVFVNETVIFSEKRDYLFGPIVSIGIRPQGHGVVNIITQKLIQTNSIEKQTPEYSSIIHDFDGEEHIMEADEPKNAFILDSYTGSSILRLGNTFLKKYFCYNIALVFEYYNPKDYPAINVADVFVKAGGILDFTKVVSNQPLKIDRFLSEIEFIQINTKRRKCFLTDIKVDLL